MTTPENDSFLPEVDSYDILHLVFEDVTNPDLAARWEAFAATYPILEQELRARIASESWLSRDYDTNSEDIRLRLMNTVLFAINALEQAARRKREERASPTTNGGVDGEDLQPLV